MTPRFKHDCPHCKFMGRALAPGCYAIDSEQNHEQDLYFCDIPGHPTVVSRFGNGRNDFLIGRFSGVPILMIAEALAYELGLIEYISPEANNYRGIAIQAMETPQQGKP